MEIEVGVKSNIYKTFIEFRELNLVLCLKVGIGLYMKQEYFGK